MAKHHRPLSQQTIKLRSHLSPHASNQLAVSALPQLPLLVGHRDAMAWLKTLLPFFSDGRVCRRRSNTDAAPTCPPRLAAQLAVNNLIPDEETARDGNCGVDAFVRGLMQQRKVPRTRANHSQGVDNRRLLQASTARVALARRLGVEWLGTHARDSLWEGMTVARLCEIVSGTSFREYLVQMGKEREWIDTACLHGLACAFGASVVIFQQDMDAALVGVSLLDAQDDSDDPLMVPVALLNDCHFWGVKCAGDIGRVQFVDKGELGVLRASMGLCPGSSEGPSPSSSGPRVGRASMGLCPGSSEGPSSSGPRVGQNDEDEDGDEPSGIFCDSARADPAAAAAIDTELRMCQILRSWDPFGIPTAEVIEAMAEMQRIRTIEGCPDVVASCTMRAEAITALAYEETAGQTLPESMRYQRLARLRLANSTPWYKSMRDRSLTRRYMAASASVASEARHSTMLERSRCARHGKEHGPGNPQCCGLGAFTGTMVYNWRVLWWSLPWVSRKELLLSLCNRQLKAHKASSSLPDERWQIQWEFLGQPVCRDAFQLLTGLGVSMLQAARASALRGCMSWSSIKERGLHMGTLRQSRPEAYMGARQWLEWYAATHAEWSPAEAKAYLPAGRKAFFYSHYRMDILRRHGVSENDVVAARRKGRGPKKGHDAGAFEAANGHDASAYALAGRRGAKRGRDAANGDDASAYALARSRMAGHDAADSHDASAYALARGRMADVPLADIDTFLRAWRYECPWLVVCKSVSMFTRCSVCEYLRLLIDQAPREQETLRQALRCRLGQHFEFQAAQRLAHNRIEEECEQSEGHKWFMLIDKMDQKKTVCPTIWSQLATKLFQDQDKRLITGLIGSMWFGTRNTTHHVRTVFNDCMHGSEMQCSTILQNLHEVAMREGHLPSALNIGADNTRKETKNQVCMWFLAWLLCALADTPLWLIDVVFLLVGHTHNKLDRLFSRIAVALRGQDYFTVVGMLRKVREHLKYCQLHSAHLAQVWRWKGLLDNPLPSSTRNMHNLDPAHAFRFTRENGISMRWKQWCTDESWSAPVQIVAPHEVQQFKDWRPSRETMEFSSGGRGILDWVDRLEAWCVAQPAGTAYQGLGAEFQWLRNAVRHSLPGAYAPGAEVEDSLRDLRGLPHTWTGTYAPVHQATEFPQDIIPQLFPSADVPPIPPDALVRIDNVTHTPQGRVARSTTIALGSLIVMAAPEGTVAHDQPLSILVGMVVDTSCRKGTLLVGWYVPELARVENFRSGVKKMVLDVFGPWRSTNELSVKDMKQCRLPDPLVHVASVLECNFTFGEDGTLPYDVFDCLRVRHKIDLTGFSTSMTRRGNLYRSYALMKGAC